MKRACLLVCFGLTLLSLGAAEREWTAKVSMSPSFRRMSVAETGPVVFTCDDPDPRIRRRVEYRYWLDVPERHTEGEAGIRAFITELVAETNHVALTPGTRLPPPKAPIKTLADALRYRRDRCGDLCKEIGAPFGGTLEGCVDYADERYVGYTLEENCYYGGNNSGEYVTTHGVYSMVQKRRLKLADFFPAAALPKLTELIQEAYANGSLRGEYHDTYADFRKKYPKDADEDLVDPAANENFTIVKGGMRWSFDDWRIVGYQNRRGAEPLHATISWRELLPILRDRSLVPAVSSAFGL